MYRNNRKKSAIITSNIGEIVANNAKKSEYTFRILPSGESFWISSNGEQISPKDFEKMYPTERKPLLPKGQSIDRKNTWATGQKAY